jgi:hypothetical protein
VNYFLLLLPLLLFAQAFHFACPSAQSPFEAVCDPAVCLLSDVCGVCVCLVVFVGTVVVGWWLSCRRERRGKEGEGGSVALGWRGLKEMVDSYLLEKEGDDQSCVRGRKE